MGSILLIRHGQASFGAADYDELSAHGHAQAALLGRSLAAYGVTPTAVVSGGMLRQQRTATSAMAAAGWGLEVVVDRGFDEFDHEHLLDVRYGGPGAVAVTDRRTFQTRLEDATDRWTGGRFDGEYAESYPAFAARVSNAFERVVGQAGTGRTVVVFSSAGVISQVAVSLLDGDARLWTKLNRSAANCGVTKVAVGASGRTLVSYNEHMHLPAADVTYR